MTFRRCSQFCRSIFKRKEGRKMGTWNEESRGKEIWGPVSAGQTAFLAAL